MAATRTPVSTRSSWLYSSDGPVIVRIPIHGADMMDLRPWREDRVLAAIAPHVRAAPRLLKQLTDVPGSPDVPASWPADTDTIAFARRLSALTQRVYATFSAEYADLFTALGIPADPLAPVDDLWRALTPRPFTCVHADVHRRNMIVGGGATTFLDWELALWGDPAYDLAVHIHKMGYLPEERDALITRWHAAMPSDHTTGWQRDLDAYLTHERIKSAIVDSVRYSQLIAEEGTHPRPGHHLIDSLTAKLNAAGPYWHIRHPIATRSVEKALGYDRRHPGLR